MLARHPTIMLRAIPGFPGYFANPLGLIYSVWSYSGKMSANLHPLACKTDTDGYHFVGLRRDGRTHQRKAHQLILESYIGPCPEGMECRHLDSDRKNNRLENLTWGTRLENGHDKAIRGTMKGSKHPHAKINESDVETIRSMTVKDACERFGIHYSTVYRIKRRETWNHA